MDEKKLLAELVHSILWMKVTSGSSHLHREEIDTLTFSPPLDVSTPSGFGIDSSSDEEGDPFDYRLERFLRTLSGSDICSVGQTDYAHRAFVKLNFDTPNLRDALLEKKIRSFVSETETIEVFLGEAARFNCIFESSKDGRYALDSLPIMMEWFGAPRHFAIVLETLTDAGYCTKASSKFQWLSKIKPHMEAVQLWQYGKTVHEIRTEKLTSIWDSMPIRFKSPFSEHGKKAGGLDVLSFATVMGHFWYDDRWHDEPEDPQSLKRGDLLRGGHISTARELGRLFREGKLKF